MDYFGLKSFIFLISSISLFFSVLIFLIYSINNIRKSTLEFFICVLFFLLTVRIFSIHLFANELTSDFPHFLLINNLTSRIGLPILFFVVIFSAGPRRLHGVDFFHLIPPTLFFIHFSPIFFSSANEKISLIHFLEKFGYDAIWNFGLFKSQLLINFMKYFSLYAYSILIVGYMVKEQRFKRMPKPLFRFFAWSLVIFGINLIPSLFSHFRNEIWEWASLVNLFSFSIFLLGIFFIPEFLFPAKKNKVGGFETPLSEDEMLAYQPNKQESIFIRLERVFEEEKPFLNPEFSLKHLERQLGISGKYIGEAVKANTGLNFASFVNQTRLNYLEEIVSKSDWQELKNKPLEVIAQELGFKSLSSFYLWIKKQHQCTPKEYLDSLEKS